MKKSATALPRRPWYGPDKLRAAYLAGQGMSSEEIARVVGGTTGHRVRGMLRAHAIPLLRASGNNDVLTIFWRRGDREQLNAAADRLDRDPAELAALIVRKVLESNPAVLRNMIHELDVV